MLANVSALVNVNWWLGIPFNDTSNWRLEIAETGEAILGDRLLGFQVGNEPDLYAVHGHRPANYSAWDYFGEFAEIIDAIAANDAIPKRNNLIAPSVSGTWTPEDVWNTGFLTSYDASLGALAVEKCVLHSGCALVYTAEYVLPQIPRRQLCSSISRRCLWPCEGSTSCLRQLSKPHLRPNARPTLSSIDSAGAAERETVLHVRDEHG